MKKMTCKFAYLKSEKDDSPYYVHLTLDEKAKHLRIYYHSSWWKKEKVDPEIFECWKSNFQGMLPLLTKIPTSNKKSPITSRKNSVKVKGRGLVYSKMLKDIVGFVEPDTKSEMPCKIECYVNSENKIIEVEIKIDFIHLGHLVDEMRKLPVFTTDPNAESVRSRLSFFSMSYIVGTKDKTEIEHTHDVVSSLEPCGDVCSLEVCGDVCALEPCGDVSGNDFQLDVTSCPGSELKKEEKTEK